MRLAVAEMLIEKYPKMSFAVRLADDVYRFIYVLVTSLKFNI